MEAATTVLPSIQAILYAALAAATVGGLLFSAYFVKNLVANHRKGQCKLPPVPVVPGWPVVGNLLQLKEKKPYKTFLTWAESHGPIYSIRTGASTVIVVNSSEIAKEGMVTRHSSISSRKLSKALNILTQYKCMVATSDYDDFHKMVKRYIISNVLGAGAQRRHRCHRDTMVENILAQFHAHLKDYPEEEAVNFREIFESELFSLSLKESLGKDVQSIYVDELGDTLSRGEIFNVLVLDPMEGALYVDWRDFFPYMRWVPNRSFEEKLTRMHLRREAVMNALFREQKKRIASGEDINCYLDFLLSEAKTLTEKQIRMLLWETIIETSDTTMVATEWAMYELANNPSCQDKLYREIQSVCGSEKLTEEHFPQLPYLNSVFHETIRKYSPAPVVPLRYVHEDTQLGGYYVSAGSEVAINIYGCNMNKNQWENPEVWNPERFLDGKHDLIDLHKTMAFGAGKRSCAGALNASLIACASIGRLVQEFEWRLSDGEEANVDTVGLTTRKLDPLKTIIKPRSRNL